MMMKLVSRRGLNLLMAKPAQLRMVQQMKVDNIVHMQMRSFAKKKGKKAAPEEPTEEEEFAEPEPVAEPTPAPEQPKADFSAATKKADVEKPAADLFKAFSVGDVKQIQSTEDHKPPAMEDTIGGRYASVLFTTASQQEALYTIYEDVAYIREMYQNSETFRLFTQNAGVGAKEIGQFNEALKSVGTFHPLTVKFLEILAENKRLTFIAEICDKYVKLYKTLNKEEKITIISAESLNSSEQDEVLAALKANPENTGKEFILEFTVDPAIKGGL